MELTIVFFLFGLTVNAKSEDLQDYYQSLQTEITTYPPALPSKESKEQNNSSSNSGNASSESLPRLTVPVIASPGTDLFHAPHERQHSTPVNGMTPATDEVIDSRGGRFVSNQGSGLFTSSGDSTAGLALITIVQEAEESAVASTRAGAELVMNGGVTAAAHVSGGREKIAASLHAPLNSENQRAVESITLLPAKSIAMLSASHPAVIDNIGEAPETEERQRKSINENGAPKTSGATKPPLNATESVFTDGEKTFVQKGSPTITRLTAVPNKTQLDAESSASARVKTVAREPVEVLEKGQPGQKNMTALSLVTRRNNIFNVDTLLPLGLSGQEVVKETSQSAKLLTTKGQASVMTENSNTANEKFLDFNFSHPSEVPFSPTGKPGDRQTSQSLQSTTAVKDEGMLKFLVTIPPSKFSVENSAPLGLSFQEVVKETSQSPKLPTTEGQTSIMMANSNTANEKFLDFKFSHPLDVPFATIGKAGDEKHSIYSPSQSLLSTTTVKDEGMLKLLVTIPPSKFTERHSVETSAPLGLSFQEVVKETSQSAKLLTTERNAGIMVANTNDVDKKFPDSEFAHTSEVPFSTTGKPYVTRSLVTSPLTPNFMQRRSTSTRDRQVGTTISTTSQSLQSTTTVNDEGMLKLLVTIYPSKFTKRPLIDTSAPLGLSDQEVVKETSQSAKLPTTKGHTSIMMANRDTHSLEVPFSTTTKPYVRIVPPGAVNEGELTSQSTSTRDRQVETTISSTSQSLQSTTTVKDEGILKLLVTVPPSKFTEIPLMETSAPLGLSDQEVVKETSQSAKLPTTKGHTSIMMANRDTHSLEVPFSTTGKPYVTSSLVKSPLTPKLLQRIVLTEVESEGELTRPSVDTSAPLGLSLEKVAKETSQSAKLLTTKGHTTIKLENSNNVDLKFPDSEFAHPLELPFSTTGKPEDESEGELTSQSTSTRDRQVGTTVSSTSQSLQSTTIVKNEGMLKLLVTIPPSKFIERPSQSTKLLTTERHEGILMANTNDVDKKFPDSEFSHPSEVPFSTTGKPYVTQSFVTLPSTPRLLQRIVLTGVESEGELTSRSTSTRDRQVGTTIPSPSQSLQSTTILKDEGMLKLVTVLPSKFTDRPSALIKVKNATPPGNSLLGAHQDISSTDSRAFRMSEHCCEVSIENRTSHPEGNGNDDSIALTDNRTGHFHTLIDKLMPAASSTTQFPVAQRVMTISAQSKNDSHSDSDEQSERVVSKLTQSKPLISASDSMHHLVTSDHPDQSQKIPTTPSQIPPREIQNLSPIFEGHAVTYSPVRQRLIPSLTGRAKPLTFLSSPTTGHAPFHHAGRVLKGHPSIVPLGHSAPPPELVTFQDLENTQDSTSFQTANILKNTEPTVFQKLLTPHSERLIRTTNTWPATGWTKSSAKSFSAQFTSTAGSDKGNTVLPSVSSLSPNALHITTHHNLGISSHFLAASHEKSNRETEKTDKAMQQDLVSHRSQTDAFFLKPSQSEIAVDSGDLDDANQMILTEQPRDNLNISTSIEIIDRKNAAGTMDAKSIVSTHSQPEQSRSAAETKAESSTGAFIFDQNAQNTLSMQNKNQTPATVLMENTVSSSQSQRGEDLRKTSDGQIDASVTPAAVESLRSTQPLASLAAAVAETPKTVEQMINQASSPGSTLSSIIDAASEGKDFNKKRVVLSLNQTTQREPNASAIINHLQAMAASSQAPESTRAPKRHLINNTAVNHLTLSLPPPYTPHPAPEATSNLMRYDRNPSQSSSFTPLLPSSPSTPSTASRILTDFSTTSSTSLDSPLYNVEDDIIQEDFTQSSRSSVTQASFFNFDHNYGSTASFEATAAESPQTASLQILEMSETRETSETSGKSRKSEGRLSTVFPSETSLSKSAEMMSDLPVMQRRVRIASPDFLSGLAQISDDICGSGNYTAEMRLTLERNIEPGDLIPALGNLHVVINLKTNSTQVNLEIKSCCLSPTITLDQFNTTCCLFSRLPIDPQGIRLLPSALSKRASFTISLFQMINYSTAYLHCDLSVCLRNSSECERCQQNRKAHLSDEEEIIFSYTANRISFGPVLKESGVSPFIETTGLDGAEAAAVVVSVSGCFLVCVALLLLWTFYRRRLERSGHGWTPYGCSRNGEHALP